MKTFGKVEARFWISPDIQPLSGDCKLLALYLLTCEHSDLSGVYRIPPGYIAADLCWDLTTTSRRLHDLVAAGFITLRKGSDYLCINKFIDHNEPTNQGQFEARLKHLESLPEAVPDISEVLTALKAKALKYKTKKEVVQRIEALQKQVSNAHREFIVNSSQDGRLERKREREKESFIKDYVQSDDRTTDFEASDAVMSSTPPKAVRAEEALSDDRTTDSEASDAVMNSSPPKAVRAEEALQEDFEHWWLNYPSREGKKGYKQKSFARYRKRVSEGYTPVQLLANVMAYARYCDETGNTGTPYVMTTEPYLNNTENLDNPWTVNYAARQRDSGKLSLVEQVEQANAHILQADHQPGGQSAEGGPVYDVEPERPGEPVFDHDGPVWPEVDQNLRPG